MDFVEEDIEASSADDSEPEEASMGESGDDNYDSMIENGTSDSDDDDEDDDGSESEEIEVESPPKAKQNGKRKTPPEESLPIVNPAKKAKNKNSTHVKPPTVQEINQLKETENLFHSNLFRLQIEEMLKQLKVSPKYQRLSNEWITDFNRVLGTIETTEKDKTIKKIRKSLKKQNGIVFPLEILDSNQDHIFKIVKPTTSFIVGSQRIETSVGPIVEIDLCVEMPKESFRRNDDTLNGNYHQKRALYLTIITAKVKENEKLYEKLEFSYANGDKLKPILLVTPPGKLQSKLRFKIYVAAEEKSFKLHRFLPNKNNFRLDTTTSLDVGEHPPTPYYNATIIQDLTMSQNNDFLEETIGANQNLRDGIKLLKIWLKQRGLDVGVSGFNGFIVSMFVGWLVRERKLYPSMSSYQIVRCVWNHLSLCEWNTKGISLANAQTKVDLQLFHQHFDVVFIDCSGYYNLCSSIGLDMFMRVKYESRRAIEILDDMRNNSFRCLFMTKMPFYNQYDHLIIFRSSEIVKRVTTKFGSTIDQLNYYKMSELHFQGIVTKLLRRGLGNRVQTLTPWIENEAPWSVDTDPTLNADVSITLGLILNPEEAFNILDKGPPANQPEAQEFRQFWGNKSTMRRFKDGSITEAVVWASLDDPPQTKRLICKEIVQYLLQHHLHLKKYTYIADDLDLILATSVDTERTLECQAVRVIRTFDQIASVIRAIDDIPLAITSIQGISPIFRYCDALPTISNAMKLKNQFYTSKVHRCVINLATSGKWPDSVEAIRRIKAAFYIQIGLNLLMNSFCLTRIGVEGFDVMKDGNVYNFTLIHPKEIALVQKEMTANGVKIFRETPESLNMQKVSVILPEVTSFLHGIYQQFPSFGPAVCLAKRWIYQQNFDSFLWPDECTELLMASLYTRPEPYCQPIQSQVGFFRFLRLLADTNWLTEMILVNFNDEISGK